MITMIAEDVGAVAVIALFVWLVPMRRHGIPGLRGRGRPPASPVAADPGPAEPVSRLEGMHPRPIPIDERIAAAGQAPRRHQHSA